MCIVDTPLNSVKKNVLLPLHINLKETSDKNDMCFVYASKRSDPSTAVIFDGAQIRPLIRQSHNLIRLSKYSKFLTVIADCICTGWIAFPRDRPLIDTIPSRLLTNVVSSVFRLRPLKCRFACILKYHGEHIAA